MTRPDPRSPPTYDEALRAARNLAQEPDTLVHYAHPGLENARYGQGFIFVETIGTDGGDRNNYVLVTTTAYGSGVLTADRDIDTVIAEHLAAAEHANRHIPDSELSVAHRAALEAYDAGLTRIDELSWRAKIDAETADYAEFVLIILRRNGIPGYSGRNILARNDFLLQNPDPGSRYTQPCPRCERPAVYAERYPRAVCDHCRPRTTDSAGRRVTGFNIDLSGGMIAYYSDTLDASGAAGSRKEECVEVTSTGMCFIDGHPATMQEARLGGIIVQLASDDRPRRRWLRWVKRVFTPRAVRSADRL
ncbi:hypothetical protein [Nocardia sp. BMG51109]|uniref:hypothetical protein n=1 Tax=Nocardia sp. BMG51109 TaxID=1056816 RepID=UPI0004658327|nr:hypothetical protein [Nocardia sp. BMG51109]